jgi:hypothetical protein
MPKLKEAWNMTEWNLVQKYVDRWVLHGSWTKPDPVAPYDGNIKKYRITFGPAQNSQVIKGRGRFPDSTHGIFKDGGSRRSAFVDTMWNKYRASIPGANKTAPFISVISHLNGDTVKGLCELKATAFNIHPIKSVECIINGRTQSLIRNAKRTTEYSYVWNTTRYSNGSRKLIFITKDILGNSSYSTITLFIKNTTR